MGKEFNNLNNFLKKKNNKYIFSKDGNNKDLFFLEQTSVSVNKNTWYILNFIEALAGSQMKVAAALNNLYNFVSNTCTMYAPIKNTHSQYAKFT